MTITTMEPYKLNATEALALMKAGDLTVEDYAKSLLSRIASRDSQVKAWAFIDPEFVLEQARKLDAIPALERGALHGIAIGVKDVILTKDMPTSYNSPIYTTTPIYGVDAAPIIVLRSHGALILGKTTTTEFAATTAGTITINPHSNPSAPRTPGGSSAGSGAAVADFQCPIALGTQTGGSTIRPASFNGIWGWKPTWGAASREGLAMYSMTCDTLGFYARSVEDLELMSRVFWIEDDVVDGEGAGKVEGAKMKVGFCKGPVWNKAGEGTRSAWEKARESLEADGSFVCEDVVLPEEFGRVEKWHANVLAGEGRTSFLGNYTMAKDKLSTFLHGHVDNVSKLSRKEQLESYDGCARLRPIWDEIASRYDVVLTPSVVDEAPLGLESTGDASFCSMWTILHCPTINVPGFVGKNDMPIGLTAVGARYCDVKLLRSAEALGKIFAAEGEFVSKILEKS